MDGATRGEHVPHLDGYMKSVDGKRKSVEVDGAALTGIGRVLMASGV